MDTNIKTLIEKNYGIQIVNEIPGPRQFVAETHIITAIDGSRYFVKLIRYSKYSQKAIDSLPVLKQLKDLGLENINTPLITKDGELYLLSSNIIIIVFNYIDAKQTYDFDMGNFAKIIATVHQLTPQISGKVERELFEPLYLEEFPKVFGESLSENSDPTTRKMKAFLMPYKEELESDWENFQTIQSKCKDNKFDYVITHGDPAGNILEDIQRNLYLIDWDEIKLAPAERDTWFLSDRKEFMNSYIEIFPKYNINQLAYSFYVHNRYWEDLLGFMKEVLSDKSLDHRENNLQDLQKDCFGWLRPIIRKL